MPLFLRPMIALDFTGLELKLKKEDNRTLVFDPVRKRWLVLTPEEHVRQYIILFLKDKLNYPAGTISVEKQITLGSLVKRFDLIIYDRDHQPWMLVECKAPEVPISETTLRQLLSYQTTLQCKYWLLTNGHQTFCADACDVQHIQWMESLPAYQF